MTTLSKRPLKPDAGNPDWAKLVAQCIDSIGYDQFYTHLMTTLRSLADFDNSVVFAYYKKAKPVCLSHTFPVERRIVFVDDYLKGPYLLDPFFESCRHHMDPGLYRLRDIAPDRFYQSEYYRSYYVRTGLSEEICYLFYLSASVAVVISLMRSGEESRFSAREFRLLENVAPIVTSIAQRHWKDVPNRFHVETESTGKQEEH